ncbi:MAG: YggS family pyridoxal phosphate-dependent enzyme [Akkermansiaceae bacterium]|nr:YggS family pyridoxal phosphate-dependent enzyme [Akkermansiaceae bacterium]
MYIEDQLGEIRAAIRAAEARAGRPAGSVALLAVSKTFPVSDIMHAYDDGQRLFGENRLQEAIEKMPQMPQDCEWHLIGPLQRNKVRKALERGFALIEAVDSVKLAEAISRIAGELGVVARVLLEVNVDGEESKHGFTPEGLQAAWDALVALPHMEIAGLMCIPAPTETPEGARPAFACLRGLAEALRARGPLPLPELSMGMSHDYAVAVEEGATIVRVGSAIFGKRNYTS